MTLKTGILAAAAALALTVPAAAVAQPVYGPHYGYREDFRGRDFHRGYDVRRAEDWRRLQWERERAYRYGYGSPYHR